MKVIKSKNNYDLESNDHKEYKNTFMNFVVFYIIILWILYFKNIITLVFVWINSVFVWILYFIIHTNNYYSWFIIMFKLFFYNKYDFVQKDSFYTIIENEFNIK